MITTVFRALIKPYLAIIKAELNDIKVATGLMVDPATNVYQAYTFTNDSALDKWEKIFGAGERVIEDGALKCGNNSGSDEVWNSCKDLVDVTTKRIFKVTVKYKHTAGNGATYLGVSGVAANGTDWVNRFGENAHNRQHYPFNTRALDNDYREVVMYFAAAGVDLSGYSNAINLHPNAKFLRLLVILNDAGYTGIGYLKSVIIETVNNP